MSRQIAKGIWKVKGKILDDIGVKVSFSKPFKVHTNASGFAIGGVLMQDGHPITFENKKLVGAQLRWPMHETELFVLVNCLKIWQHYQGSKRLMFSWTMCACTSTKVRCNSLVQIIMGSLKMK
jgi:hypothetical protein